MKDQKTRDTFFERENIKYFMNKNKRTVKKINKTSHFHNKICQLIGENGVQIRRAQKPICQGDKFIYC